ncbi:hypothetical protein EVAR_31513_1 [Eumeta japonica]|uniref:Uncharacterized protein n=1 Tax=Eumeta variegata TaxID=151549 RepID=A0A4C1YXG9_EUMVA|nr:hypothetical protein EVAR_31513_1 [Eumeta japonica]
MKRHDREGSYGRSGGAAEYRGGGGGGGSAGGGAVGSGAGSRMSLLGSGYLPPPAPLAHHPPPADPPPFKKIRLAAERQPPTATPAQTSAIPPPPLPPHSQAQHQPLRIDTRESVNTYTVEVLSPNPPSDSTIEDQNFRTTKDDLLQQISKPLLALKHQKVGLENLSSVIIIPTVTRKETAPDVDVNVTTAEETVWEENCKERFDFLNAHSPIPPPSRSLLVSNRHLTDTQEAGNTLVTTLALRVFVGDDPPLTIYSPVVHMLVCPSKTL